MARLEGAFWFAVEAVRMCSNMKVTQVRHACSTQATLLLVVAASVFPMSHRAGVAFLNIFDPEDVRFPFYLEQWRHVCVTDLWSSFKLKYKV